MMTNSSVSDRQQTEINTVCEKLCQEVASCSRDQIREDAARLFALTSSGLITVREVRTQLQALVERFGSLARLAEAEETQVRTLTAFCREGLEHMTNIRELILLFINDAELFCLMIGNCRRSVPDQEDFSRCMDYLNAHLTEPVTMEETAAHFGYHPAYFSRKFKQCFHTTFRNYLLEARLSRAAEDLRSTAESILNISETYCFCSQSHFQNAFRERYGVTPRQYRQQHLLSLAG